ncbi:MAG: thiamine phosphate synthase [Elusimicrobiota bacterium]
MIRGVYLVSGLRFHKTFDEYLNAVEAALKAGIKIFQLRVKDELKDKDHIFLAHRVRELTKKYNALFIINDRPDIALLCGADGLHLGPKDMSVHDARQILDKEKIIGLSCHSEEDVMNALNHDITYLSVGPVFKTDSKKSPDKIVGLDLINYALENTHLPVVAIGGIGLKEIPNVLSTGVKSVGVIRAVMEQKNIYNAVKEYISIFDQNLLK